MIRFKIIDAADQKFSTVLNRRRVTLRVWYSGFDDRWSIDLSLDGDPVINGRKIVTGVDLLAPFNLGIGVLFAMSDKVGVVNPGRSELPEGLVHLYHATEGEVDAAIPA